MRAQANDAESQAQERAGDVAQVAAANRDAQDSTYSPRPARANAVPLPVQKWMESLYRATSQRRAAEGNALKTQADAPPVMNTQGQATGRIVNLVA